MRLATTDSGYALITRMKLATLRRPRSWPERLVLFGRSWPCVPKGSLGTVAVRSKPPWGSKARLSYGGHHSCVACQS